MVTGMETHAENMTGGKRKVLTGRSEDGGTEWRIELPLPPAQRLWEEYAARLIAGIQKNASIPEKTFFRVTVTDGYRTDGYRTDGFRGEGVYSFFADLVLFRNEKAFRTGTAAAFERIGQTWVRLPMRPRPRRGENKNGAAEEKYVLLGERTEDGLVRLGLIPPLPRRRPRGSILFLDKSGKWVVQRCEFHPDGRLFRAERFIR